MAQDWQAVDDYIAERLLGYDPALEAALAANAAGGLRRSTFPLPPGEC